MELVLSFVLIVLLLASSRKSATGRRGDLGLVVVMLSLVLLMLQLQAHGWGFIERGKKGGSSHVYGVTWGIYSMAVWL
jgi:hypothetical protein